MFGRRKQDAAVPEVGGEAPNFQLPSAQGGQLQLSMRTVRGPVVVAFYRPWSEEDVGYFKALAEKEDEINMAGGSVAGIGVAEADEAREFVRASGIKSYVLYDYARVTSRQWGLLEKNKEHGEHSQPAVFVVGGDHEVAHAWVGERPTAEEILAKVSSITGLPKPPAEKEEKPKKKKAAGAGDGEAAGKDEGVEEKPKKLSAEERERIKAERRAAREAGKSVKTGEAAGKAFAEKGDGGASEDRGASGDEKPKKMSAEERERIKAERRAAREAGKSLKTLQQPRKDSEDGAETAKEKPAAPAEASDESNESSKSEGEPEPGEARVEAELDTGAGEDSGSEEQADSLPEATEAGERREKKRSGEE